MEGAMRGAAAGQGTFGLLIVRPLLSQSPALPLEPGFRCIPGQLPPPAPWLQAWLGGPAVASPAQGGWDPGLCRLWVRLRQDICSVAPEGGVGNSFLSVGSHTLDPPLPSAESPGSIKGRVCLTLAPLALGDWSREAQGPAPMRQLLGAFS